MLRFPDAYWRFMEKVNGNAPFFGRKSLDNSDSFFPMWTAMLRFLYDFGIHHTSLTTGERQCSVFSSDFQRFRRYWTDMLRFLGQFQADFQLKSGWIEPLLVGGYAPFSPFSVLRGWHLLSISWLRQCATQIKICCKIGRKVVSLRGASPSRRVS